MLVLVLASLAFMGHGRRVHSSGEQARRVPFEQSQQAVRQARHAQSVKRLSGKDELDPTAKLAEFILALHPASAFNPSSAQPGMRRALDSRHQVSRRCTAPHCQATPAAQEATPAWSDLVGDAGVLKYVMRQGSGAKPMRGATVEVHYEGKLADTGAVFDSSRSRGKPFKFTLGQGKVIGGWEVGVSSMQVGEISTLTCAPQYAYGPKGIPPMIPPSATLNFEVELISVQVPEAQYQVAGTFAGDAADTPRTVEEIKADFDARMAGKPATKKEGWEGFVEWAQSIYIFGFFSTKGDRPILALNPLLTFPLIFIAIGFAFYFVVELGSIHRGESVLAQDDLSGFLETTEASPQFL